MRDFCKIIDWSGVASNIVWGRVRSHNILDKKTMLDLLVSSRYI